MAYGEQHLYDRIRSNILNDDVGEEYKRFLMVARRRKQTKMLFAFFLPLVIGCLVAYKFASVSFFESVNSTLILASVIAVVLGAVTLNYLEPSSSKKKSSGSIDGSAELKRYMDRELFELRALLHRQQKTEAQGFSQEDKEKVFGSIQAKLESEALSDYVAGINQILAAKAKEEILEGQFGNITLRLSLEVDSLAKRGNLNLFLGIMTTLIGLSALAYSVFYSPDTHSPQELLVYFVPRVSLVLLIEVFAYFFLKLYKQSLSEIKYFQNEITNIQAKQLAVSITSNYNNPELMGRVVESLSDTERNFILNKGQTTVDLERDRISGQANLSAMNALKEVLVSKK